MHLTFFSPAGWESWHVEYEPLIRPGMAILIDEDLRYEDERGPRSTVTANQWLRELPVSGAPSPNSWETYARSLRDWLVFLSEHAVPVFGDREPLRAALALYAGYRLAGPLEVRLAESSWNLHITAVASLYDWAVEEGHATAVPFTHGTAKRIVQGRLIEVRRNMAKVRAPKAHTKIKYLEQDFTDLLVRVVEGLLPDGSPDPGYRGHHPGRNAAMVRLVLSSGLRRQEFTHLLAPEIPPAPTVLPILFPVAAGVAKGRKQRTTWVSYQALAAVHRYLELERPLAIEGSSWRPAPQRGEPPVVTAADWHGGVINGRRRSWSRLTVNERLRLVDPDGGSLLLAVQRDGAPFLDWGTVLRRASEGIQTRFEPRFPHVHPHRLRHTMALKSLEELVAGYYAQAAKLVSDTDDNPALALYLTKADPMEVLRDLLGHSSVATTQVYLSRLDVTRVFRDAYEQAGPAASLPAAVRTEVDGEFDEDDGADLDDMVVGG